MFTLVSDGMVMWKYSQDSHQRTSLSRASPFPGRNLNNRFFLYIIYSEQRGNSNTRYTSVHWPAFGAEKFRTTAEIDDQWGHERATQSVCSRDPSRVFGPTWQLLLWQLVMTRVKPLYSTRRAFTRPQGGQGCTDSPTHVMGWSVVAAIVTMRIAVRWSIIQTLLFYHGPHIIHPVSCGGNLNSWKG